MFSTLATWNTLQREFLLNNLVSQTEFKDLNYYVLSDSFANCLISSFQFS